MISKQTVTNLESQLLQAIRTSDLEVLDALLHKDLLFNLPNGQTITKAMDMETYRSGNMKIESLLPSEMEITTIESIAVVAVTIALKATYNGEPVAGIFRYLRVWKQSGDEVKVVAGSCVPVE